MGKNSAIQWTDHTFNPWWGCVEVSPACDHCYARTWAIRTGFDNLWGVDAPRRFFGDKHWNEPLKWEREAAREGRRARVFCASMADVFDNHPAVAPHRERLWRLIHDTPHLDWLLLTKRIGNVPRMTFYQHSWPDNVWLGISVVTQAEADRDIPKLRQIPAYVRFLSCEPLIEAMEPDLAGIDWVIVGGESGGKARRLDIAWPGIILNRARRHGAAFFMKQGSQKNWDSYDDFDSFPPLLQVREWPRNAVTTGESP